MILFSNTRRAVGIKLEFKWQDMWVGIFYKRTTDRPAAMIVREWWICFVPCLPIHIEYVEAKK